MIKKKMLLGMILCMTVLAGCTHGGAQSGTENTTEISEETSETPDTENKAGMANPWVDVTLEDIVNDLGITVNSPEEAGNIEYRLLTAEGLYEMQFDYNESHYTYRLKKNDSLEDISGLNYTWTNTIDTYVGTNEAERRFFDDDKDYVDSYIWYNAKEGITHSLTTDSFGMYGYEIRLVTYLLSKTDTGTDYDTLYDPIIQEHLQVVQKGYDSSGNYKFLLDGVKNAVLQSTNRNLDLEIGVAIKDITGDDIPELLIGENINVETGNGKGHIYGAFSYSNNDFYCEMENTDMEMIRFTPIRYYESYVGDGSSDTRIARTKKILKQEYGEDFDVFEIDSDGPGWDATVSPVNNPEILFGEGFDFGGLDITSMSANPHGYYRGYLCYLAEKKIQSDLEDIIPGAYIRVNDVTCVDWDNTIDFRGMSLEEMLDKITFYDSETVHAGFDVDIFIDESVKPTADYEAEYKYFDETINDLADANKMLPVSVSFRKLKRGNFYKTKEYLSTDRDWDSLFEYAMGLNHDGDLGFYEWGIFSPDSDEVGNPPNIAACFEKAYEGYIGSLEEYERRRKLLDKSKQK